MIKSATKRPTKIERVLSHLVDGNSLNRFEAEHRVNDHCLHSTMSTIKNQLGVCYSKKTEVVPGYERIPTRVTRYWLEQPALEQANTWLWLLRHKRGARGGS